MDKLIWLLPALIVYIAVLAIYFSQARPKGQLWFGVTLPADALKDERLQALQREYRNSYRLFAVLALVALAPLFWLGEWLSLIYLFLWIAGVIYTSAVPFKRIHHKAAKLKRDHNWFVTPAREVRIEADMKRMTAMKPISPYWYVVPALLSCGLIAVSVREGTGLLKLSGFASLAMTAVMFALYLAFSRGRLRAHSRQPAPNLALNNAARRYWSILWLALAIFEAINAFIAYGVLSQGTSADPDLWLGGIAMISLVPLAAIYMVHHTIRELEYRYADTDGVSYMNDDDEYWRHGMTYYNPDTGKVFVEKRVGTGLTVNMATRAGKSITYGSIALVAAIVIPIALMIGRAEAVAPVFLINEEGMVTIEDTGYPYSFSIDDVLEITLEDKLPSGFRSNGIATSVFARGNFKLNELGPAKLYVFKQSPPFIVVKLEDMHVVMNNEDPAATRVLYEELLKLRS